ncbi:MAG: hypothetical protein AAF226_02210 [Verrucomicrobiota bacterium]
MISEGLNNTAPTRVGKISSYYGGLFVKHVDSNFYFGIAFYDGTLWQTITEELYHNLLSVNADKEFDADLILDDFTDN